MVSGSQIILAGGFHEVVELCQAAGKTVLGIIDPRLKGDYFGCPVLGTDEDAPELLKRYGAVPVVLTPDDPAVRARLAAYYSQLGFNLVGVVHPEARVSPSAKIGVGVVVQYGVHVSSMANIGEFVKMNVRANVMHDVQVGSFTTIAPNAVILGRAVVGEACYIGANATILPGVVVGSRAMVGAGAVVTRPVPEGGVVKGNPAR
jgi:UDP-N-acetylbacillosamine N-acetyltransferase